MKKKILIPYIILLLTFSIGYSQESPRNFIYSLQSFMVNKNFPPYLKLFSEDIREQERENLNQLLNNFSYENVYFSDPKSLSVDEKNPEFTFQVLYLNNFSALIEIWQLKLGKFNGSWVIKEKKILKTFSGLFRLRIPGTKVNKVKKIKIRHYDIELTFEDALVFYDNIPQFDTALIILGKGKVTFYPSSSQERHQLSLYYKKDRIEDDIEYGFFRFAPHFIQNIEMEGVKNIIPNSDILNRAYSLFTKYYSKAFTIETPLSTERFSLIPQDEDMVIEFKGRKVGEITYIYSSFSKENINLYDSKRNRIISLYSPFKERESSRLVVTFAQKAEPLHYDLNVYYNPEELYFSGSAKIKLKTDYLYIDSLQFKLNKYLSVIRIQDGKGNELFFSRDRIREMLYIYLIPPHSDYTIELTVYYKGKISPTKEISDVLPQLHPLFETPINHNIVRYKTFLYSYSSLWYPVYGTTHFFTANFEIKLPYKYDCLANGKLLNIESIEKKEKIYHFLADYPVKYLSFIVGEFKLQEKSNVPFLLELYSTPETSLREEELVKGIIEFYRKKFGDYPFPHLKILKRGWENKGGHSPSSLIIINSIPRKKNVFFYRNPVDLSRWRGYFLAHEIAHQWWGQTITWDTYHDLWLSEGFAQFSALLFLKEKYGEGVFRYSLEKFNKWVREKSNAGPIILGSRIGHINDDDEALLAILYNKSAMVLNMLKDLMGEEKFFEILKKFINEYKFSKVNTSDFKRFFEKESGLNLQQFFRNWFYSYELPEVYVFYNVNKSLKNYYLRIRLIQRSGNFIFPLWFQWKEGRKVIKRKIIVNNKEIKVNWRLKFPPKEIKVNPFLEVPGKFSIKKM